LLLETPEAGLVAGMQWLQTTYTVQFNLAHNLNGHLFQGRYKAIVVDGTDPSYFRILSDYIHLNPLRAGILNNYKGLVSFPWSSFPAILGARPCPAWLVTERVLDSHAMTGPAYAKYLQAKVAEFRNGSLDEGWDAVRSGWYLGSEDFRDELIHKMASGIGPSKRESYSGGAVVAHDESAAESLLERGLAVLGLSLDNVQRTKCSDARKQALIWLIRGATNVSSDWICSRLGVGHRSNISRALRRFAAQGDQETELLRGRMLQCKD
jgi:putative transposase